MTVVLMTWNPGPHNAKIWTVEEWDRMVATSGGFAIDATQWSVGNHKHTIHEGDTCFLLRQGAHERGIVARGEVLSEPFEDEHFDEDKPGQTTRYVSIDWQESLAVDDRLTVDELATATSVDWAHILMSGKSVVGSDAATLVQLWEQRHATAGPPPFEPAANEPLLSAAGAGFGDAEQNREVELAATRYATEYYREAGYEVEDVSANKVGWDLTVTAEGEEWHVELKGVSGSDPTVLLTKGEHLRAETDAVWSLAVVVQATTDPYLYGFDADDVLDAARPFAFQARLTDVEPTEEG